MSGDGIVWRTYEQTLELLREKRRPVFAFVLDDDGTRWPFLREIFKTLPEHAELRDVLNGPCLPLLLKADALPPYLKELGAGQSYHIAILSPAGLTPLAIFDHVTGDPKSLATNIADCLEKVSRLWSA